MADTAVTPIDSAWDDHKPPPLELIDDCVHCGFCLPTCPTYVLWGEEMDSPRGRIQLMSLGHQEGTTVSDEITLHIDNCLGCMACVTACPSGVQYDKLIEDTRGQVERQTTRPLPERLYRGLIFALFPHPARLRALTPLLALQKRLGLDALAAKLPKVGTLAALAPDVAVRKALTPLPAVMEAKGERRGTVGSCRAASSGCSSATSTGRRCTCSPPRASRSTRWPNRAAAARCSCTPATTAVRWSWPRRRSRPFEDHEIVVTNAAGCGSAMKDYAHALREEPAWRERAEAFAAKVRDVNEFLAEHEPRAVRHAVGLDRIAYHDACHLAHAQGIRAQPRALLRGIPGLEVVDPAEWELCCGSAGVYNMINPEPARQLGERKVANLRAAGAQAIVAANPGCSIQIASISAQDGGEPLRVLHPMEVLSASLADRSLNA